MDNFSTNSILYHNCRESWPSEICAVGNVCGLIQVAFGFVVFLPQVYRNFRHKSVEGLSVCWLVAFFTADIINLFFIIHVPLPLFSKISAIYSPIINIIILFQIIIFTPTNLFKIFSICVCCCLWLTIILVQIFLSTYEAMQWITVTLIGLCQYPQVSYQTGHCYS